VDLLIGRAFDEFLWWAGRGLTAANPGFIFVLTLGLIAAGLELSHYAFKRKGLGQARISLILTSAAAAWSLLAFHALRTGRALVADAHYLSCFFAFTGLLALACLGAEAALYIRLQQLFRRSAHDSSASLPS
jgi:heme/copper-type cytochrome/quinol oxidase subunit 3